MAFNVQDLNDLIELLRRHPEWREAVRREVLTQELLDLPEVVRRLAEAQTQLAVQVRELATEVRELGMQVRDQGAQIREQGMQIREFGTEVRELARIVRWLDGRVGNLEGWRYEQKFNARARVTEIVRRPVPVNLAELDLILDARDEGRLSQLEWRQLLALDFLFKGQLRKGAEVFESLVAVEVSQVVDSRDVQSAYDRAGILTRSGLETIPAVGGRQVTEDADALAKQLGVQMLIDAGEIDQRSL